MAIAIGRVAAIGLAVLAAAAVVSQASALGVAATVNPLRPVAPGDVYADPSHGFLVLVEGDAQLHDNETEGPVAIGGDVEFTDYRVGLNDPGTYVLAGDTQPTSLVVGGRVDFAGSATGTLTVLNNSYAKIGDLSNADVLPSGGVTHIVPKGATEGSVPAVRVNTSQPAGSVGGAHGFDFAALFATYRDLNAEMSSCPSTVVLRDQNGQGAWNGTDPNATVGLVPGQNVLTLTGEQLTTLDNINPVNGMAQPSDAAWLIVNVVVDGDYTFSAPQVSWQGNEPSRHVIWNFTTSGTITLPPGSPTVWGTIYAPNAALVDRSSSNIEGAVVVRTATVGGADNGGEIHNAPFGNTVTTCGPTTTTTTAATTATTTTTTTTESASTTSHTAMSTPDTTSGGATTPTAGSGAETALAATGVSLGTVVVVGGLLVLLGAAALVLTRRRASGRRPSAK